MKKTIISIFSVILGVLNAYSQIAIMTDNPASNSVLHVDAAANNSSGGANINLDDVVVDKNGNVGIGTINPQAKLHIVTRGTKTSPDPQLRIQAVNAGVNKVLMSDNNGSGEWSAYVPGFKKGTVGSAVNMPATLTGWGRTNMFISLDPGQWMIFYTVTTTTNNISPPKPNYRLYIQVYLGEINLNKTSDAISKNQFANNGFIAKRTVINGWVAVENKGTVAKDYYLYVGSVQWVLPGLILQEVGDPIYSTIYAFRINMLN